MMRFLRGIEKLCLRTTAAGSVSWVLAHVGTDNQSSSACLQSSTTLGTRVWSVRLQVYQSIHAHGREKLSQIAEQHGSCVHHSSSQAAIISPSDMHASLIGPAIFAIQQLLFQRALQPVALSLSSWQPNHSAMPDATFARNPTTTTAATRQFREAVSPTLRAKDVAAAHSDVVADIRKKLEERGVSLPASHFADVDVELARYAITVGLLSAQTAADRAKVVEAAAARAQATAEWLLSHSFMPEEQLGKWANVVHWSDDDADGHPVLVVHLEAALQQDAAGAASAAEAILSHMEAALRRQFDNNPGSPEQLVVVLDSRGASTLQFRRLVRTIQSIAVTLNRHYPARLHRLYLVNAPVIVHLPVRAIKALLHPSTSSKIIICDLEDPRLPVDLDYDSASSIHQTAEAAPP